MSLVHLARARRGGGSLSSSFQQAAGLTAYLFAYYTHTHKQASLLLCEAYLSLSLRKARRGALLG